MLLDAFEGLYCGPAPVPFGIWLRWNLDPLLLAALAALAWSLRHSRAGLTGVGVLSLVFVTPLCALSAALFSARVVHHVVMITVAAPLLGWALARGAVQSPLLAVLLQGVVLWVWHLPGAYDLALGNMAVYWTMQVSLLGTAVVFWAVVLNRALAPGLAAMAVLSAYLQMALLGALLTFAPEPLYAAHAVAPLVFGLTPLVDQQLGGLVMWVPAGLPYLAAIALLARRGWRRLGALA